MEDTNQDRSRLSRRAVMGSLGVAAALGVASIAVPSNVSPAMAADANTDRVYVPDYCTGSGTQASPWVSSDGTAGLAAAISAATAVKRTVYLPGGYYATSGAVDLNFSTLWTSTQRALFSENFKIVGNNAKVMVNGGSNLRSAGSGITVRDSAGGGVFFWEISGIHFEGNVDSSLLHLGSTATIADWALNSCVIKLKMNNKYVASDNQPRARGITLRFALESQIDLVSTAAQGYGAVLELVEFSTIKGSFSNGQPTATQAYDNGLGLYLLNCASNAFTSVNLEVCYNGAQFVGDTRGNVFTVLETTNCDNRGWLLDNTYITTAVTNKNVITFLNRRPTLQGTATQTKLSTGSNSSWLPIQFEYP